MVATFLRSITLNKKVNYHGHQVDTMAGVDAKAHWSFVSFHLYQHHFVLWIGYCNFAGFILGECKILLFVILIKHCWKTKSTDQRYGGLLASALFAAYLVFFFFDRNAGDYHTRGQGLVGNENGVLLSSLKNDVFFRRFEFLRGWRMWRHCSNYFPSTLVKTVDLPADRNYIFAVFPHGVIR